jgi:hypothetical protein
MPRPQDPERIEHRHQPKQTGCIADVGEPGQCRAEIAHLTIQPREPLHLRPAEPFQRRLGFLTQGETPGRMPIADGVIFATASELFQGVLADRLQHGIAGLISLKVESHQILLDE